MRKVVKNYNFCDFDLKIEEPNLSKTKLSVDSFANLDVYTKSIKPVAGFINLVNSIFYSEVASEIESVIESENANENASTNAIENASEITSENLSEIISESLKKMLDNFENQDLLNDLVYLTSYDYFDEASEKYKTIYFGLDSGFKLYKFYIEKQSDDTSLLDGSSESGTLSESTGSSESETLSESVVLDGSSESGVSSVSDDSSASAVSSILFVLKAVFQDVVFGSLPKVFENNGKVYFYEASEKFLYFEKDLEPVIVSSFVDIVSNCDYYNQTFFITESQPYKLFYTDKNDIENISDDLSLYECVDADSKLGKLLKVVSFKNNIFVISQYGISKLVSNDDEFYLTANCVLKSKIARQSIFEINDYIIFIAGGRCYLFDGNEFEEIFSSEMKSLAIKKSSEIQVLDEIETNIIAEKNLGDNLKAVVFDNRFFMLADLNFDSNKIASYESSSYENSSDGKLVLNDESVASNDESVASNDESVVSSDESLASNSETQKVLIEFDVNAKRARFFTIDGASDLYVIRSMNCYKLVISGESNGVKFLKEKCETYGTLNTRFVKFNSICFDDNAEKIISSIKTVSEGYFTLKISSENGTKVLPVSGNLNVSALGLSGYSFDIEIYSDSDFVIKSILFSVQTITE